MVFKMSDSALEEVADLFARLSSLGGSSDGLITQEKLSAALTIATGTTPSPAAVAQLLRAMERVGGSSGSSSGLRLPLSTFTAWCSSTMAAGLQTYEELSRSEQALLLEELGQPVWELLVLFRRKQMMADFMQGAAAAASPGMRGGGQAAGSRRLLPPAVPLP
ncbi:hypothetical protein V8C86DRAFT_973750 [Haematococcus lacustris]